jgi:hypothetical protein
MCFQLRHVRRFHPQRRAAVNGTQSVQSIRIGCNNPARYRSRFFAESACRTF